MKSRFSLRSAVYVLLFLGILFPVFRGVTSLYNHELTNTLRYESITYLRTLSEYLNARLHQYEILLDSFPDLRSFGSFTQLLRKDAIRLTEIHNVLLIHARRGLLEALNPADKFEKGPPLDPTVSFSCFIYSIDRDSYLFLSRTLPVQPGTEALSVVLILKTIQLLPEHALFPYPIQWIALMDSGGRGTFFSNSLFKEPPSSQVKEVLLQTGSGQKRTGTVIKNSNLYGWDSLRDYPLQLVISLDIRQMNEKAQRFAFFVFAGGYAIASLLGLLVFASVRYRMKARRQEQALKIQKTILQETHHRIKNNIQILSSLFSLQQEAVKDPGIQQIFTTAISRLKVIALLHEELYHQASLHRVSLEEYIRRLLEVMVTLYDTHKRNIHFQVELDPEIVLDPKKAQACGFIVQELVTNAIKHAFPSGKPGTIRVIVHRTQDSVLLQVEDDGVGFSTEQRKEEGLGMPILQAMVDQLEGTLSIDGSQGVKVRIQFPLIQA